jgi:hypothetical protein
VRLRGPANKRRAEPAATYGMRQVAPPVTPFKN